MTTEQTSDPTLWRYPSLWSANRTIHLRNLEAKVVELEAQAKIDNDGNQDWINSLCSELCKMEDALGFKNDCHDKDGKWVPTIGPWLERVRDLIAAEGELGDAKSQLEEARWLLSETIGHMWNSPKNWLDRRDAFLNSFK